MSGIYKVIFENGPASFVKIVTQCGRVDLVLVRF